MKKIVIISMLLIIALLFISCNNSEVEHVETTVDSITQSKEANIETSKKSPADTPIKPFDDGSNIEKVYLSYFRENVESLYDKSTQKLLKEIKDCNTTPEAILTDKIGKISIKYKDDESLLDYAELYLGSDNCLYAKYISKSNESFAYKIDEKMFAE